MRLLHGVAVVCALFATVPGAARAAARVGADVREYAGTGSAKAKAIPAARQNAATRAARDAMTAHIRGTGSWVKPGDPATRFVQADGGHGVSHVQDAAIWEYGEKPATRANTGLFKVAARVGQRARLVALLPVSGAVGEPSGATQGSFGALPAATQASYRKIMLGNSDSYRDGDDHTLTLTWTNGQKTVFRGLQAHDYASAFELDFEVLAPEAHFSFDPGRTTAQGMPHGRTGTLTFDP